MRVQLFFFLCSVFAMLACVALTKLTSVSARPPAATAVHPRVGASATAEDSWWAWSEDRDGLLLFLETILDRQADWVLLSPAAWPSLEHWARQRAGRPARQHTGVEAWAIALE